ncbi:hypothetical protein PAAM106076_01400 [Paracoccus aminovorans]|nr:hypothetical protein JCM7685_1103 [Paracoccus aminovorans]
MALPQGYLENGKNRPCRALAFPFLKYPKG